MRRLTLDRANRKIGGVCAGVAKYLDADVTVVRIIFVLAAIFGCSLGIWVYLVIWALAPVE